MKNKECNTGSGSCNGSTCNGHKNTACCDSKVGGSLCSHSAADKNLVDNDDKQEYWDQFSGQVKDAWDQFRDFISSGIEKLQEIGGDDSARTDTESKNFAQEIKKRAQELEAKSRQVIAQVREMPKEKSKGLVKQIRQEMTGFVDKVGSGNFDQKKPLQADVKEAVEHARDRIKDAIQQLDEACQC